MQGKYPASILSLPTVLSIEKLRQCLSILVFMTCELDKPGHTGDLQEEPVCSLPRFFAC